MKKKKKKINKKLKNAQLETEKKKKVEEFTNTIFDKPDFSKINLF